MYGKYNAQDAQLSGLFKKDKDDDHKRRNFLYDELIRRGLSRAQSHYLRHTDVDNAEKQAWQEYYLQMIEKYGRAFLNDANNIVPPGFIGYSWEQQYANKLAAEEAERARLRELAVQQGKTPEEAANLYPVGTPPNVGTPGATNMPTQNTAQTAGISSWMYAAPLAIAGVAILASSFMKKKRKK